MSKYQVEALRTIRSLQTALATDGRSAQAEQMRTIGDQVKAMAEELRMMASALRAKDADYAALRAHKDRMNGVVRMLIGCIEDVGVIKFEEELEAACKALEG